MATDKADAAREKERQEKAPLTGALSVHDVLRHLIAHGPARNDAERAELLYPVDQDDPQTGNKPEAGLSPRDRKAERDRLTEQQDSGTAPPLSRGEQEELDRLHKRQSKEGKR